MPKIVFRGKTYYSEFEMPPNVRQAYRKEKRKERAVSNMEEKPASSRPLNELPETEDIYRQSAPDDMKHLPSDESLYRPSRPIIDPVPSTIEPNQGIGMRGLAWGVIVALVLSGIAFLLARLLL